MAPKWNLVPPFDVYPVVLYQDGWALLDVELLAQSLSPEASRAAKPDAWAHWREVNGEVQIQREGKWEVLAFPSKRPPLPANFRLDGDDFRRLSGAGTIAMGGGASVAAWSEYRFTPDGHVFRTGGAGGSNTDFGVSVSTSSVAPNQHGTYRIDGMVLELEWDDGTSKRHVLVADATDPKTAIWLDGSAYSRGD